MVTLIIVRSGAQPALLGTCQAQAAGHPLEMVYVSLDGEGQEFRDVVRSFGGWLALPQADADRRADILSRYQVSEIPTLVLLDFDTGRLH